MNQLLRPLLVSFIVLMAMTGVAYPFVVSGIGQLFFPHQANGSVILRDGQPVGSVLIGQHFRGARYFWGRPSATSPMANNAAASGGSNLGPLHPALIDAAKGRKQALLEADPHNALPIPAELVSASASGLDPHISLAAAQYQVQRVARARKLDPETVQTLIAQNTQHPALAILGESVVNVLQLNLALETLR